MRNYDWANEFYNLYHQATELYQNGKRQPRELLTPEAAKSLASIGCTPQELFDFVEDECTDGEPTYGTVLLITAVRRDYFLTVQQGQSSGDLISMQSLPAKDAQLAGLRWLPRLIAKAQAKLRGQMPAELMYGCGGDRAFLESVDVHPADFLRLVWMTDGDDRKILHSVSVAAGTVSKVRDD